MKNLEIRLLIANKRLRHYEVAEALGITDCTFSRWMATEMSEEKKTKVLEAIAKLH